MDQLNWHLLAEPILERACVWFSGKGQKLLKKKGQNIWKFGQKCAKFKNILKRAGDSDLLE